MRSVTHYIAVDPRICHGQPHFRDTRVLVHTILELLEAGISVADITSEQYYPALNKKHIEAALHYASELLKTRAYVPQSPVR